MQLTRKTGTFDVEKVQQILVKESKFITDLFSIISLPTRNDEDTEEEEEEQEHTTESNEEVPPPPKKDHVTRAKSLTELQQRLHAITSKKKLTYKEKLTKKNLKNRMKKKNKQDERNAQQKLLRAQKLSNSETPTETTESANTNGHLKTAKPVFNSEGKMVFSKFDFSNIGGTRKGKKQERDPRKLLENLEKQKEKLNDLRESGEVDKAVEIKEKTAWKNALAKAEGHKVKDDPILLKKTVKRQEQKKRSSRKKWKDRMDKVEKGKQERQNKRTENIDKRKKEKKKNKLKRAVKKGKIIPGF